MFLTYSIVFISICYIVYLLTVTIAQSLKERFAKDHFRRYENVKRFIEPEQLLQIQIIAAGVAASVLVAVLLAAGVFSIYIIVPAAIVICIAGYFAPFLYFILKAKKRQQLIETKLLDFTMSLTNSMKAGLGLPQALEAVTKRLSGPIQEELQQLLREYRLGLELSEAFERFSVRVPCEDIKLLVTSIKLTTRTGGSLVEVLEEMVDTIRQRTEFQDKVKTLTAQGRFEAIAISLAPVIAFGVLWFIDSELMTPLVTTGTGWIAIGIIAVLISIGFYVINKIVTIEV